MANNGQDAVLNRRSFLRRCCKAGLLATACGLTGWRLHDTRGPLQTAKAKTGLTLPDFAIPAITPRMGVAQGEDRQQTLQQAFKALGGLEVFVKPGDRVLLKVNAAFASPPSLGATTHPDLVAEVARQCYRLGAARVMAKPPEPTKIINLVTEILGIG